jgi:hypothetical protein
MSSEKPTPERIVVDFPKTEIADEKTLFLEITNRQRAACRTLALK